MKYITEFRRSELAEGLIFDIRQNRNLKCVLWSSAADTRSLFQYGHPPYRYHRTIEMFQDRVVRMCYRYPDIDKAIALVPFLV